VTWRIPKELIFDPERHEVGAAFWVIYFNPRDYPDKWVVRVQYVTKDMKEGDHPRVEREPRAVTKTLREAHRALPPDLFNIHRQPGDDLKIVEVWI